MQNETDGPPFSMTRVAKAAALIEQVHSGVPDGKTDFDRAYQRGQKDFALVLWGILLG